MVASNVILQSFNKGLVSRFSLARTDIKRIAMSASTMVNWMCRTLGSMMLRPGTKYLNTVTAGGLPKHVPFVFSVNDTAIIQFGADATVPNGAMWVLVNEQRISRVAVTSQFLNGGFLGTIANWTSIDQAGATSAYALVDGFNCMALTGTGTNYAGRYQQVVVAGGDIGKEHAVRIYIYRGPVTCRIGSTLGAQDYLPEARLATGVYSMAFTPTGNFFCQFTNETVGASLVATTSDAMGAVYVEPAGELLLPVQFGSADLPLLRWDQSADVVYMACGSQNTTIGYEPSKVIRYGTRSWAFAQVQPNDGPFGNENFTKTTLVPTALSGDTTVTASQKTFNSADIGRLIRIASIGQETSNTLAALDDVTDPIEVTGVGTSRTLHITVTGAFTGTLTLQQSVGAVGAWENVPGGSGSALITAPGGYSFNDGFDNQIIFYRYIFDPFTSGTPLVDMKFPVGSINGIARITSYSSETVVGVRVLSNFGGFAPSTNWWLGLWGRSATAIGFPTCVRLYQGRLFWPGRDYIIGSVSGVFESYDDTIEGDSGPLIEQIGSGPVDQIDWIVASQRLVIGPQSREISIRSSALNEPLTPTDFNLVTVSTMGSAPVDAAQIDTDIFFVQGARQHVVHMKYTPSYFGLDYAAERITEIDPDLGLDGGGFNMLAVQRKPDTRIHGVLEDGSVAILVYDQAEEVQAWVKFQFGNAAEVVEAFTLPGGDGDIEDKVYYVVLVSQGLYSSVYWLVRWARQDQCIGGTQNLQADAYVTGSGAPTTTLSGLTHLNGLTVVVWADGKSLDNSDGTVATFVVSAGAITVPNAVSSWVVGLPYTAQFQSTKLAYNAQLGTALMQPKRITSLGIIRADTHNSGLKYGRDFSHLENIPLVYKGATLDATATQTAGDDIAVAFPGTWDTDSRLCMQAASPRPACVLAALMELDLSEKS